MISRVFYGSEQQPKIRGCDIVDRREYIDGITTDITSGLYVVTP
jgi:hypothetical protein